VNSILPKSFFKRIRKQAGFSLIELMASVAVGTLVIMMAGTLIQSSYYNFYSLEMKLQIEESVNNAALVLKNYLSMAVNLQEGTPPLATFQNNVGLIRRYNLNDWTASSGSGNVDTIAFFLRENLRSGNSALTTSGFDRFPTTAIFFQRPTQDRFGVLYIQTAQNYTTPLRAQGEGIRVPGVVDFEIMDLIGNQFVNVGGYAKDNDLNGKFVVGAVLIKVVLRNYFGNKLENLTWCPQRFIAANPGCQSSTPYRDSEKIFLVNVRNNILSRGMSQRGINPLEPHLPTVAPPISPQYRRNVDTVYFLKPSIPIGVQR
jgi:prepilin-type N-terminal cleavage/methylation domain-containing protein